MAQLEWSDDELGAINLQIYKDFVSIAEEKLGLDRDVLIKTGILGDKLFDAEFTLYGPVAYATSVILPIRNAYFSFQRTPERWRDWISKLNLEGPILDYGCGVGYSLAFLSQVLDGQPELYGLEVAGAQWGFMSALGQTYGFSPWENEPVGTVLCLNVLEHLQNPIETLEHLYTLAPKVYGNCNLSECASHIAPMEDRLACLALLKARGGLLQSEADMS